MQEIDHSELREKIALYLISRDCTDINISELKKCITNCHIEGGEQFSNLKINFSNNILYDFGFDGDNDNFNTYFRPDEVNFIQSIFKNGDNILFDCTDLNSFKEFILFDNILYKISENGIEEEKINSFKLYSDQLKSRIKLKSLDVEKKNALIKIKGDSILVSESNLSQESIKLFKNYFNKYKNKYKDNTIYIIRLNAFNIEDIEIESDTLKYFSMISALDNNSK